MIANLGRVIGSHLASVKFVLEEYRRYVYELACEPLRIFCVKPGYADSAFKENRRNRPLTLTNFLRTHHELRPVHALYVHLFLVVVCRVSKFADRALQLLAKRNVSNISLFFRSLLFSFITILMLLSYLN